jgi:predicted O-methyltransferase YrrM
MLMSFISKARDVCQQEGAPELIYRGTKYFISIPDPVKFRFTRYAVRNQMHSESDLEDILDTIFVTKPGYGKYQLSVSQLRGELKQLAELVENSSPETVLEIGTSNGGTFYTWCRHLDSVNKIISLDLPGGDFGGGYSKANIEIYQEFAPKKELHFIRGNSHDKSTYEQIRTDVLNNGEEIDFLFIDGDHTYQGVKQDFEWYSKLVSDGGIVAFHDIAYHPDNESTVEKRQIETEIHPKYFRAGAHPNVNVHDFWDEIKTQYDYDEIISHPKQTWAGIGVLYMGQWD